MGWITIASIIGRGAAIAIAGAGAFVIVRRVKRDTGARLDYSRDTEVEAMQAKVLTKDEARRDGTQSTLKAFSGVHRGEQDASLL